MRLIDPILSELKQEAETTRRVLDRVPEAKLGWKPHTKSMSLGALALHVATTPGSLAKVATIDTFAFQAFSQKEAESKREIMDGFAESIETAVATLGPMTDAYLLATWTGTMDGRPVFQVPRIGLLRAIMLNHWYHHRGQLTVYLRMQDVPLPAVYGPTADENPFV